MAAIKKAGLAFPKKEKLKCQHCGSTRIKRMGALEGGVVLYSCLEDKGCGYTSVKMGKSKMKNESCFCAKKHRHDSRSEARDCDKLHLMKMDPNEGILNIYKEKVWHLHVNGVKVCEHKPDFTLELKGGKFKVVESKGFATAIWALKRKMFKAEYPDVEYDVWWKK